MLRKTDLIGVVGVLMLGLGALLFLRDGGDLLPMWIAWLVGPLLWYGGFLVTSLWFLTRIFGNQRKVTSQASVAAHEVRKHPVSNFLEHDSELAPEAAKSHTLAYGASFLALALVVPALCGSASAEDAAALFKTKCAPCHGANADAKTPMGAKMNIRDMHAPEVQKQSDSEIATIITKGKNKMPSYEGKLTPDQISQLAAYIHGLGKK